MIPADELSPSGSDCGCAVYIDRQLASAWGGGAKMYRAGPYFKGKPEQGYQIAADAGRIHHRRHRRRQRLVAQDLRPAISTGSSRTSASRRSRRCRKARPTFDNFSSRAFFARLLTLTMEGFFGDPIYGGNRNKASWRMLGFPGLPATYANLIDEYRDKRYVAEPQSIADFS